MTTHLLVIIFLIFNPSLFAATISCQTSQCHQSTTLFTNLHAPLKSEDKGCRVCHTVISENGKHPNLRPMTVEWNNNSCMVCHEETVRKIKKEKNVHQAIDKKGCTSCHSPHGSKHPKLLKEEPKVLLCLTCHDKFSKTTISKKYHQINSMNGKCLSCHVSHSSQHPKLLRTSPQELCFGCHKSGLPGNQGISSWPKIPLKSWHTPAREGECFKCHDHHGSDTKFLLSANYQKHSYTQNIESDSALCFKCHNIEKFKKEKTQSDTQFRNATTNLHQVHIFKSKEVRNCSLCHNPHASYNKFLIEEKFNYQGMNLPLNFKPNKNGGTCTTACHKNFTYDREKAYPNESDL